MPNCTLTLPQSNAIAISLTTQTQTSTNQQVITLIAHIFTPRNVTSLGAKGLPLGLRNVGGRQWRLIFVRRMLVPNLCWNQGTILPIHNAGYM